MQCSRCREEICFGEEFSEVIYFTGNKEILSDGRVRLESYIYSNLCSKCANQLVSDLSDTGYEVVIRSYYLENPSNF